MPAYDGNPAHAFQKMLDPANGLVPGDPARMATPHHRQRRSPNPAPLRMVLGSQALQSTTDTLRGRIADFETQAELAASTDFPPGEQAPGRPARYASADQHIAALLNETA